MGQSMNYMRKQPRYFEGLHEPSDIEEEASDYGKENR